MISNELLDEYFKALSCRATSYEIKRFVEEAVHSDSDPYPKENTFKF